MKRYFIREVVIEDALFMWSAGESVEAICKRIGIGRDGLDKHFRLAGIPMPWVNRVGA